MAMQSTALGFAFTASVIPQWTVDPDTLRVVAVNDAAIHRYGFERARFVDMPILDLHPPDERDAAQRLLAGPAGSTDLAEQPIWHHLTPLGERRVRMAVSDVPGEDGTRRLVQILDATAEVRAEKACTEALEREREARAQAEAVRRNKEMVLATLGHEVRQRLAPLRAAITVVERGPSPEATGRGLDVAKRQIALVTRLVDDLIDAARVQHTIALQRVTADLRQAVEEAISAHFAEMTAHELVLDTRFPPLPVWVAIDGARIQQVLTNLLSNAIRHTGRGGRLRIQIEETGDAARLTVRDDGRGIDGSVLPHIFEPFVQAAPRSEGGLGVGLSIVRALVELHGGQVSVSSDGAGQGAAFVVTLPCSTPPAVRPPAFASDLRSVAELIRVEAAAGAASFEGALNGVDTPLLLADDRSRLLNANPAALAMTGYETGDLARLTVPDILAMDATLTREHWQEFLDEGQQEGILVLRRKDGARVPIRYSAVVNVVPGLHLSALGLL